ncbi:hypothetical protein F4054_14035 [Candidatus Poribacteria bacterium]|nr:hypothetical protein [Candidatus Poribacteria bacterium]MYG05149.1 hypothetical protein [Candidatus Poribacteria bacterium]MYK23366.1 hypothetical protein [Candidatus Poribacteria bacterium]
MKNYFNVAHKVLIFLSLLFCYTSGTNAAELPKLLKATLLSETAIQLQFDGQLEAETAEDLANYQIAPDAQVEYALLDDRLNRVLLLTSPLEIEKTYRLTLTNIQTGIVITLPPVNEITFGTGDAVTFSGGVQDTTLHVNKDRKTRNDNAGAEPTLLCNPTGSVFFVAFDLFDAFEDMGIREPTQILEATITLHVEQCETDALQTVLYRRVLLPWKEGRGTSTRAEDNELTYNSALHRNLPWNKRPAQAMLSGIDGDTESDYNGSEDVAHRIDGTSEIQGAGKHYTIKSELLTEAVRFWVANPDYNYGYLFALQDGNVPIIFTSKEATDETLRPTLTIRYQTVDQKETSENSK